MPKKSKAQGRAAGMAVAIKEGKLKPIPGSASAKMAESMNKTQLKEFAQGTEKGLPMHKKPEKPKKKKAVRPHGLYEKW